MKVEEDGLLIEIKQDLLGVEASIGPIDALYRDAQAKHDETKIKSYAEERAKLIASRDRLHKEVEELEAYDELQEHRRISISTAWTEFREKLAELVTKHGK
jgi:hypothetical protein